MDLEKLQMEEWFCSEAGFADRQRQYHLSLTFGLAEPCPH